MTNERIAFGNWSVILSDWTPMSVNNGANRNIHRQLWPMSCKIVNLKQFFCNQFTDRRLSFTIKKEHGYRLVRLCQPSNFIVTKLDNNNNCYTRLYWKQTEYFKFDFKPSFANIFDLIFFSIYFIIRTRNIRLGRHNFEFVAFLEEKHRKSTPF